MPQRTTVHSWTVEFEENCHDGIRYLRDHLDLNEAKVFFDEAKLRGAAEFEDNQNRNYTLVYRDGLYVLVRR